MSYSFTSSNDINTSLVGNITATQTTIVVASIAGFPILPPNGVFPLKIIHPQTAGQVETIYVTSYTGTTLTVLRGQENSTAYAWSNGDTVYSTITAAMVMPNPQVPQGRLSASSTSPLYNNVEGATTVYYVPYNGGLIPYYNGSSWGYTILSTAISNSITDDTVNPGAMTTSQSAALYVWNNNGVMTLTRGPAVASTSTTDPSITWINGMPMNASAITNGPPENQGLYVGSISTYSGSAVYYMRNGNSTAYEDPDYLLQLRNYFNQIPISLAMYQQSGTLDTFSAWTAINARLWLTKILGNDSCILTCHVQVGAGNSTSYVGLARQASPSSLLFRGSYASDVAGADPDWGFTQPFLLSQQAENLVTVVYLSGSTEVNYDADASAPIGAYINC